MVVDSEDLENKKEEMSNKGFILKNKYALRMNKDG